MPTQPQIKRVETQLRQYRKKYLHKAFAEVDESATRIMVNFLLCDVLGYSELVDIKTEYRIRDQYADYVIQIKAKKQFIVEVKSIQFDLNQRHLRQSLEYGVNGGIDWIILTNGRQLQLYKIIFDKPVRHEKFFDWDLSDYAQIRRAASSIAYLAKRSVLKGDLDQLWQRQVELSPDRLAKIVYDENFIKLLRRQLKKNTKIHFKDDELYAGLHHMLSQPIKIDAKMPRVRK